MPSLHLEFGYSGPRTEPVQCMGRREREKLREEIGNNLTLPKIVEAILEREEAWKSFASFCGNVMRKKEDAERIKRGEQQLPP